MLTTRSPVSRASCFLIVDRRLLISAVSARAEALLRASEQQTVGLSMVDLLVAVEGAEAFAALVRAAVLGANSMPAERTRCLVNIQRNCMLRPTLLDAWAAPCGPPSGALLVLEPRIDALPTDTPSTDTPSTDDPRTDGSCMDAPPNEA